MGTHWPILDRLSVSGIPHPEDIQKFGYHAVISVHTEETPGYRLPGVEYYHLAMSDGQLRQPSFAHLQLAVLAGIELLEDGKRVLIHCRAGRDRSCTTAALVTRYYFGWSGPELIQFVRERRPRAINNKWFEAYLAALPAGTDVPPPGSGRGVR